MFRNLIDVDPDFLKLCRHFLYIAVSPVSDHKGVNIKGIPLDMIFLSQKDKSDILFDIENNIDYIAASFVRTSEDVADLRKFLNDNGGKDVKIIAKIENQQGVKNFKKNIEYKRRYNGCKRRYGN